MRAPINGVVLATAVFFVAAASAQTPQTTPAQERQGARNQGPTVTVEGCVVREADVPGRDDDDDDFILTDVKMIKGTAPAAKGQPGATGSVGTSGAAAAMYDIEGIADAQLSKLVGQRVQIEGRFDDIDDADDKDDLMDIRGTVIRQVEGQCSMKR